MKLTTKFDAIKNETLTAYSLRIHNVNVLISRYENETEWTVTGCSKSISGFQFSAKTPLQGLHLANVRVGGMDEYRKHMRNEYR